MRFMILNVSPICNFIITQRFAHLYNRAIGLDVTGFFIGVFLCCPMSFRLATGIHANAVFSCLWTHLLYNYSVFFFCLRFILRSFKVHTSLVNGVDRRPCRPRFVFWSPRWSVLGGRFQLSRAVVWPSGYVRNTLSL